MTASSTAQDVEAVARIDIVPKILETVCQITGMGFAAVARVTEDRWVACAVRDKIAFGLKPGSELEIRSTICNEIRDSGTAVVIDHVAEDPDFCTHHTPLRYGFQSYISTPIYHQGVFFGTLCAIDPNPARLKDGPVLPTFELFAELIGHHLDSQDRLTAVEEALIAERDEAELRDQFIAVLGHDLRNPLAALHGGTHLLMKNPSQEKAQTILRQMESSVGRMAGLVNNVMDFARGRLGGGFDIELQADSPVGQALQDVIAELRTAQPHRIIEADVVLSAPVACDCDRVAQLASNLIANALTHGFDDMPVRVLARTGGGRFEMQVINQGETIRPETMQRLFQPFSRAAARPNQQGLGLGLYIASEIARAHSGELTATSKDGETRFIFSMPLEP